MLMKRLEKRGPRKLLLRKKQANGRRDKFRERVLKASKARQGEVDRVIKRPSQLNWRINRM